VFRRALYQQIYLDLNCYPYRLVPLMSEPTLQNIFGANATQTATQIIIQKADLPMTASATNRGEQVLAAIVKNASTSLTATNFNTNPDQSITIGTGFDQLAYRTVNDVQQTYLQNQLTLSFAKLQSSTGITPDDY
jgi:D-alanyl-D-alanine dipeptidase